jgi:hypothetical protein
MVAGRGLDGWRCSPNTGGQAGEQQLAPAEMSVVHDSHPPPILECPHLMDACSARQPADAVHQSRALRSSLNSASKSPPLAFSTSVKRFLS